MKNRVERSERLLTARQQVFHGQRIGDILIVPLGGSKLMPISAISLASEWSIAELPAGKGKYGHMLTNIIRRARAFT